MAARSRLIASAGVVAFMLSACGGEQEELSQWMDQQRREVKPSVEPLSPPKKFVPQPYAMLSSVEPFSSQKL
ncbi:MAG TPA: pilus assembly protein PilP, partial [Burkholderiaceae bacterium]|nr:pilus assembly protein PilP [Burkholderiaceae bacterium]